MNLSTYQSMDPHLLVGLLNTALRNESEDLEDLIRTHDFNKETLIQKLKEAGYQYVTDLNQFRSRSEN
tara:strand:- start:1206 stop:1409 length:204 start_codon:yes stop_codon:yes gene_type:complete